MIDTIDFHNEYHRRLMVNPHLKLARIDISFSGDSISLHGRLSDSTTITRMYRWSNDYPIGVIDAIKYNIIMACDLAQQKLIELLMNRKLKPNTFPSAV